MFKIDNFSWNKSGTNIIINDVTQDEANEISNLFEIKDDNHFNDGEYPIYGEDISKIFLFEMDFIKHKGNHLRNVLDKLNEKDYSGSFCYYSPNDGVLKSINEIYNFEDFQFIEDVMSNNILISQEYRNSDFYLSPKIFETIKIMQEKYHDNESLEDISVYLRELFTLLIIAEKSEIKTIDNGDKIFVFTLFNELKGNIVKCVKWGEWNELAESNYFSLYKWSTETLVRNEINSQDKKYVMKQANLRIKLIRYYLKEKKQFQTTDNSIDELNTILNRVHKNETEEYFKQQNKLKDEMIELNKSEIESKKSITNRILGLLTTVSIGIFSQFFEVSISSIEDLLATNFSLSIIFFFAFIAVLFLIFTLYLDIKEKIDYYTMLRNVYINDLNFSSKDFESKLRYPKMWKDYQTYWILLFVVLFIALLGMCFYVPYDDVCYKWIIPISIYFGFIIGVIILLKSTNQEN